MRSPMTSPSCSMTSVFGNRSGWSNAARYSSNVIGARVAGGTSGQSGSAGAPRGFALRGVGAQRHLAENPGVLAAGARVLDRPSDGLQHRLRDFGDGLG